MGTTPPVPLQQAIIQHQQKKVKTIPSKVSQQVVIKKNIPIAKAPAKQQFFYIHPIRKQQGSDPFIEEEPVNNQRQKQNVLEIGQICTKKNQCEDFVRKISVCWDRFTKIKKKNYLEDYIYMKQIGKGAFGTVSKVKMKYGGICRAAKIIKCSVAYKQKGREQKLLAEVEIPIKLDHPNIAKLFQVYQWKQQFVLITELCQGGDLYNKLKSCGRLSELAIAQLMRQVLRGIHYLHTNNIVHRDIKLQNVLYDNQSKTLKLIDFGVSTKLEKGRKLSQLAGTPYYLAPQVIKGQYDEKCDIWSCGVMLYILICGSPPFRGKSQKEVLNSIMLEPLQFKGSIWNKRSKKCIKLITSMLNKNSSQRLSALQCLNSPWMVDTPDQEFQQNGAEIIANLQNFHFKNKLKAVVYTFIASQLYSNKDKQLLLKAFKQIDKDNNGVIAKQQLIEVFNQYSSMNFSTDEIEKIIAIIDTNESGLIDFTQFLVAASNEQQLLAKQRLQSAFAYLDTDHSGYISIDQVKAFLDGSQQTADQIKKIFEQVDINGDGTISKKEFMQLLLKKN